MERGRAAGEAGVVDKLPPLILEFHQVVARASGNAQLARMLDGLLQRIAWGFELEIEDRIDTSWADHAAIATAILGGSPVQAGYLMDEHIRKDEPWPPAAPVRRRARRAAIWSRSDGMASPSEA